MQNERQMIGDYEILASVHIGVKEVMLGSNENSPEGQKFVCGYLEKNELFYAAYKEWKKDVQRRIEEKIEFGGE